MAAMIILVDTDKKQVEKLADVDIQDEDWEADAGMLPDWMQSGALSGDKVS